MRKLKSLLRWTLTGSFTLLLSACYGSPVSYEDDTIKIKTHTSSGQPIKGLEVDIYRYGQLATTLSTDSNGMAIAGPLENMRHTVIIKDIDGATNGGSFAPQTNTNATPGTNVIGFTMQSS